MTKTFKKSVAFLSAAVMVMAMLLYFPGGTFSNIDWGLKASAATITSTEPSTDGSGVYQIGTAAELYWFAGLVNGTLDGVTQNTAAWAKLTANITVNNNVLVDGALNTTNSGSFTSWTPIGNYYNQYTGTFNGNGKTISGLYFDDGNTSYVGLFGCVGSGGNVSNVGIVDSYFNGKYHVGGVCGNNEGGTIQNCYNTGAVSGNTNVGGVCGHNYKSKYILKSTIENCYNTGAVSGSSYVGGVCGYNSNGTITNCYFDSDNYDGGAVGHTYGGTITDVAGKTTNAFEKGEVCYLLQSGQEKDSGSGEAPMVWGQTIGTDKAPVLTSDSKKTVYLIDGTYSNTNSEITEKEHNFGADFRCTNCGNYEAPELNENVYEITNASQLYWFAEYVNNGNTSAEAILKENIVVNENVLGADGKLVSDTSKFVSWTPIGSVSNKYTGTFDGNGKTISGLYLYNGDKSYVGLFGYVGSGGNVSNVGVVASYFKGKNNVGGVCGFNEGGTITNCYNTGAVSGSDDVGGVCGYNYSTIQNCYSTGGVSGSNNVGGVCGYNFWGTIENCYFDSNNYDGDAVGSTEGGTITDVEGKTTNAFEKGEVCYLLQGGQENDSESEEAPKVWGQTIGTDKAPVLTSDSAKTVYRKTTGCATYSNTKSEITEKAHSNLGADFKCTDCGNYVAPELNKDVYEITNASQLYWFAKYVNKGNTSAKAILKENIVVNENVLGADGKLVSDTSKFVSWTPIGSVSNKYTGTFDGNGKTISGLYFDNGGTKYVGLFGYVGSGGNVSNVGVVASYFNGSDDVGGVCGYNSGGTITNCYNTGAVSGSERVGGVCGFNEGVTIENCYNTGAVNGTGKYVGGVCGWNNGGTITNCYNTGTVTGTDYVGGVCGYNFIGTIKNCYNTGAVRGSGNVGGVSGYNDGTIENCYNTGVVSGSYSIGGVSGYNEGGTITNCYFDNDKYSGDAVGSSGGIIKNVEGKTSEDFAEGEVCYLLNNGTNDGSQVWYQTINSDSYPLLDNSHGTVYASKPCPINFSNTDNLAEEHNYTANYDYSVHTCTKCDETHDAEFNANDTTDTISVCCGFGSVTLKDPTELTYNGEAKAATVDGKLTGFATPKILYNEKNGTAEATETAPTNAGTYVASITYTIGGTNYSVNVEYTIEEADPVVTADTNQNVVCGVGTFTEPVVKDVDGNTLAGTIKYTIPENSDATADDVKNYLKTLPKGSKSSIGYTFTPTDTTNYKTATGTINYTMIDVAFMVGDEIATAENAVTVKANPTYGDTWTDILTLNDGLEAVLSGETVTDSFSFDVTGSPNAGNAQEYNVLFNGTIGGKTYTDHVVATGTVDVAKKELTVSAGTYKVSKVYDGTKEKGTGSGTLSVSGIINDDDVTVKVDSVGEYSASDVGNDYKVAVAISLSGDKADNYTLGTVSSINVPAAITKAEQTADVIDPVVEKFDCCSVTLAKVDGYEYSMDGETWQDSNVFTGLTAGTKYTFYQRIKATANYEASANSTEVLQTTAEHDYSAENAKPEALYKKATCTSPAVYYYSCSICGDVEGDSTHTFTNGSTLDHNDTDNDNRCDTCGHIMDGIGAKLAGYSLSLSGNIGVNFYMELSDEVVVDETAYMQFTLPNGEKPQVKVSEAEKVTLDNKEYYVFTCEVAAKEMDNTITAQIITSDGEGVAYKYTVRDYADYILDEANGYDDNTKAVVSAMLSYGDYAKAYFSGEELTATSEINAVTSDMLAGYAMTESGILPEGIEYYGSTLLLESETTIRHYFKVTEGTDISAYNMTEKGGYYYIQCSDIPAGSLGTAQDISVGEYTISYSPMSYAYAALNSDSTSDNLKNLVKALYIYYQNAYAYNNSNANAA